MTLKNKHMKKNYLLIGFSALSYMSFSQTITVRDQSTREPLQNVIIKDSKEGQVKTDIRGNANISSLIKTDSLTIFQHGYFIKRISCTSQQDAITIDLAAKLVNLDEIIFSANRTQESKMDVPYSMEIIKQKDIEFANSATSGDMLQNTGQVFLQKSQAGGGSPSMRGFEANKVLLVIDGVRMNNAIYRGGHLQDVMTIDPNMLDRTEIIFGSSSTVYGSDALGGVMHFYTKNAQLSNDDKMLVKANAMVRYASAAQEKTTHLDFNVGWKKIASLTNITYSDFGDIMSGTNKLNGYTNTWDRNYYVKRFDNRDSMVKNTDNNLQIGSAYKQIDIMQRFQIKTGKYMSHNLNLQYSTSSFVPRYDRLAGDYSGNNLKFAENGYGPQNRLLAAYTINSDKKTTLSDNVKLIVAYQKIDQDRITRKFQNLNRKFQNEDVSVLSANIDVYKKIKTKHELRYGAEITSNDVKSTAHFKNINTDIQTPADTRYADGGSKMSTMAIYFSHAWEVNNHFIISDGLRFTSTSLSSTFKDTTFFKFPFTVAKQTNQSLNGNIGFTWKSDNDYKMSMFMNTGFRAPNVDDMSKVFESSGNTVIVPNPQLKPEYTYNFEWNLSKAIQGKYKFDITAYYTNLTNALVVKDFKLNGKDSALYNGTMSKVQATQNADKAYIYGLNGGVQFDFNSNVSFKSVLNYTYGRYVNSQNDTVVPLDHISPLFGQTSILYKAKNVDAEFFVRYNGKKSASDYSLSGEDNASYSADKVNGYMPSWFTLNVRVGINITKNLRLNAACENITDNYYRVFASGINASGRNVIISLRYKI